jgi:hypothetical protein
LRATPPAFFVLAHALSNNYFNLSQVGF